MTSRDQPRAQAVDPQSPPRLSGDEPFVPASHVLITDRQVSHPAFRLWCVLHRLWFLHEPPVMELLQELMGTTITDILPIITCAPPLLLQGRFAREPC